MSVCEETHLDKDGDQVVFFNSEIDVNIRMCRVGLGCERAQ